MHPTAITNADLFFKTYVDKVAGELKVVEVGSQDVNGSLRQLCPKQVEYVGVDFVDGKSVDIVLGNPYELPFEDASVDIVLSSSVFEHSDMFWLLFTDIMRVLKPQGLFYLDSGQALVKWANRCGFNADLLESFVSAQWGDIWNDFVAVFIKDANYAVRYPNRILHVKKDFFNGRVRGEPKLLRHRGQTEDLMKLNFLMGICGIKAGRSRHRLAKFLLGIWRQ